jgi:hypothetical protein
MNRKLNRRAREIFNNTPGLNPKFFTLFACILIVAHAMAEGPTPNPAADKAVFERAACRLLRTKDRSTLEVLASLSLKGFSCESLRTRRQVYLGNRGLGGVSDYNEQQWKCCKFL